MDKIRKIVEDKKKRPQIGWGLVELETQKAEEANKKRRAAEKKILDTL